MTIALITAAVIAAVEAAAHADEMDKQLLNPNMALYFMTPLKLQECTTMKMHFKIKMILEDDQDKEYEYKSESDKDFQADTDEEESESDDNTEASAIPGALNKTQEPVVLTQEEEPQPQVLTQVQENPIQDESNLRGSSQAKKTTHKMREYKAGLQHTQLIPEARALIEYSIEVALAYVYSMMQLKEHEILQIKHATPHLVTYKPTKRHKQVQKQGLWSCIQ